MHQYVLLLVDRLLMTVGELVMAYACVERVLVLHPTTMRVNSIRPMLLGACIIACKTSRDGNLSLWQVTHPLLPLPLAPDRPEPRPHHTRTHTLRRARPRQFQERLHDVLDVDVALLAYIEHQMLEVLHWSFPMGPVHQTYADAIFEAASHLLGRTVAAPQVLHAFDEPASLPFAPPTPAAYAAEAAAKSGFPPSPTPSPSQTASPTSVSFTSPTSPTDPATDRGASVRRSFGCS
eukprot:scaffold52108_cov57-Phaeocystis_antarctica.AAC.4